MTTLVFQYYVYTNCLQNWITWPSYTDMAIILGLAAKLGVGEWEWGMGNGEWGMGNGE